MNAILDNFSNPALLFFLLGIIASQIKSDLQIPETSAKFISVYLLLSIGFKGGQELIHAHAGLKVLNYSLIGITSAFCFPLISFRILKKRMGIDNAAAIASLIIHEPGNLFLMGILGASASYIAVPAAMRQAVPNADPGIYLPMALGMTFPFNIIVGLPIYWFVASSL